MDGSVERRSVPTLIWEERFGPNHTKHGLCTAMDFA